MADFRRWYVPGGTYFFTVVTHKRRPIFGNEAARRTLREAIETVQARRPFEVIAICLLPDHLHTVWAMPAGDANYSTRWRRIKEEFTRRWLASGGDEAAITASRQVKQERGVWQRRFWEHTVRDDPDLQRCVNYTHWNPCKHKLVARVRDWQWSSFHRFVDAGEYEPDWGASDPTPTWNQPECGE